MGNGRDGGQRLASEPLGHKGKQILGRGKFGCGVTFKTQLRVLGRHALAVVEHVDGRSACVKHVHFNASRTRIHGILHQFLDHGGGTLNDLTRGNLIGHVLRKFFDQLRHPCDCMNSKNFP